MANNQKNNHENPLVSWILTIVMLALAWPIGLILLFRMLTVGSITSPRKPDRSRPIDVRASEVPASPPHSSAVARQTRPAVPRNSTPSTKSNSPAGNRAPIVIGKNWGRGLIIAGAIVTALFGFLLAGEFVDMVSWGYYSYMLREFLYLTGFTATGLVLLFCGIGRRKKAARYRRYLTLVGKRDSLSIEALANAVPVSYRKACDDLQDMLERGFLPAGYIDAAERRIIFSDAGLQEAPKPASEPAEPKAQMAADDAILVEIKAINDDIDDVSMSQKIDRIGEITGKILDYQRKNPDAAPELHNFLNYYLPTTLKILHSYAQMEAQGIEGENISATKARIEGMMDKVVEGFEKRLDKLFQSDALDISSDVQVLEQMLKKDGLASDGMLELKF